MHAQVLLAGPLMAKALRERLLDWGVDFARVLQRDASRNPDKCDLMVRSGRRSFGHVLTVC